MTDAAHVLDNLGWHALNSNHAHWAIGAGLAKRYPPEMTPLVTIAGHNDEAYHDLAQIAAPGEVVALFGLQLPAEIPGWTIHQRISVIQMVSTQPVPEIDSAIEVVTLTAADVPDILHLIDLTHPGPFLSRTIEMGHYIGIRQQGELVAMSGERSYPPGFREISTVCTHSDHIRKGYARLLVSRLVNQNWLHGDVPFLHVMPQNAAAIRLYEALHFCQRCEPQVIVMSR